MVKIALQMKANLENVETLCTQQPDFRWFLKIKCSSCNEESDKWHDVSLNESVELKTGRGCANFVCKCKICGRENQMDVVDKSFGTYSKKHEGKFQTMVEFDCRGMEPTAFSPREGWIVSAGDSTFNDVDLTEGEWVDYDEKNKQSVGIYDLEFQFVRKK